MKTETQQEATMDLEEQKEDSHSPSPLKDQDKPPSPTPAAAAAVEHKAQDGVDGTVVGQGEGVFSILTRAVIKASLVKRALLGLRISEILFCLISFSVMAADKIKAEDSGSDFGFLIDSSLQSALGLPSDSFDRYEEFRYCLAVNVIGFVYSGIQTSDLVYYFLSGKNIVQHHLRPYFDFAMDQILTYLVMSASSSAASLLGNSHTYWTTAFADTAKASVAFSFLTFFAFASTSVITGHTLCTRKST